MCTQHSHKALDTSLLGIYIHTLRNITDHFTRPNASTQQLLTGSVLQVSMIRQSPLIARACVYILGMGNYYHYYYLLYVLRPTGVEW